MIPSTNAIEAKAERTSFCALIGKKTIRIPNYQREYAQGRPNVKAELIRVGFIQSLKDALKNTTPLELDFIFGGSETDDAFLPVDGQQRLTMLFLLHWYIFARAGRFDEIAKWQEGFVYATRSTSADFCRNLCDLAHNTYDFSDTHVARQITDKPWCVGSMQADPTVKSILVVLDEIHSQFAGETNFDGFVDQLQADDCPITFYCLDLQNIMGDDGVKDLYIKMNARGVALTDFELFKAALQKTSSAADSFDLMGTYLSAKDGSADTAENRTRLIGQFNNAYTNFFFNLIDDGIIVDTLVDTACKKSVKKQMFDTAMMNFILEMFCADYFCAISEVDGISQRNYTTHVEPFRKMSGKELSRFIEKSGDPFNQRLGKFPAEARDSVQEALHRSFQSIVTLLDLFSASHTALATLTDDTCCSFNCADLIKTYATDPQVAVPTNQAMMSRIGVFSFFLHFGKLPTTSKEKAAYQVWNRFVWKIDKNALIKNAYEAIETIRGYRDILSHCPKDNCTPEAIWTAIAQIAKDVDTDGRVFLTLNGRNALSAPTTDQLHEEVIKAKLIVADANWAEVFTEAEDYFYADGQLWFLLRLNEQPYDLNAFKETFAVAKDIFDHEKNIHNVPTALFEKALLAQPEFANQDHLVTMGKHTPNTKRFVGKAFSDHVSHNFELSNVSKEKTQFTVVLALLKKLLKKDSATTVEDWLNRYVAANEGNTDWKKLFIRHHLIDATVNGLEFKNGFEPSAWVGQPYTAVYTNAQKRTVSGELNTFALAVVLTEKLQDVEYRTSSEETYLDDSGFPHRYLTVGGEDIGYKDGSFVLRDGTVLSNIDAVCARLGV